MQFKKLTNKQRAIRRNRLRAYALATKIQSEQGGSRQRCLQLAYEQINKQRKARESGQARLIR